MLILFLPLFLILLLAGLPIFIALIIAPYALTILTGQADFFFIEAIGRDKQLTMFRNIYNGMNSNVLMAIPFFLLAGEIMNKGGITERLVRFSSALVGHWRGGLAQVNIVTSMLFAGMSGSAVADTSAVGRMMIPEMVRKGYTPSFSAAVTAASSVIGPIIPPSGIMIIYAATLGGVSVRDLFAAGIVPGVMVGAALMAITWYISKREGFPTERRFTAREKLGAFGRAFLPMLTPIFILGPILFGIATPTEASAFAVTYALILSLFLRTVKLKDLPQIFIRASIGSAVVLLLIGAAWMFKTVVFESGAAQQLAGFVTSLTDNKYVLLFLINILLFIVGMFLDAGPAIVILAPILAPIFIDLGVDPVHFAIIMSVNLTVGLATPPMGLVLFVASSVSGVKVEQIARAILPFLLMEVLVIFLITFIEPISMTIPNLMQCGDVISREGGSFFAECFSSEALFGSSD